MKLANEAGDTRHVQVTQMDLAEGSTIRNTNIVNIGGVLAWLRGELTVPLNMSVDWVNRLGERVDILFQTNIPGP